MFTIRDSDLVGWPMWSIRFILRDLLMLNMTGRSVVKFDKSTDRYTSTSRPTQLSQTYGVLMMQYPRSGARTDVHHSPWARMEASSTVRGLPPSDSSSYSGAYECRHVLDLHKGDIVRNIGYYISSGAAK